MTRYFVTCARGLEPVLARELAALGAAPVEPGRGGVTFHGDSALLYRANLWLRERKLRPKQVGYQTPNDRVSGVTTGHHQNAKPPLQGQKRI